MQVIFFDDDNKHRLDPIKARCTQALSSTYENLILMGPPSQAYDAKKSADYIKSSDLVVIWNNLKPSSVWVIDMCRRFNVKYLIVERGIVPCQGSDNFSFFAGGICFDNTNLTPERTTPNYDKNVEIIKHHYESNGLVRREPTNKVVVVGQLDFDSTMTHYTSIPSWDHLLASVQQKFNGDEVVFCKHPRDNFTQVKYRVSSRSTIEECLDAKAVVLVSSTIAYELAGLEIPLAITGTGPNPFPLLRGWTKPLECQATALDFHFNSNSKPSHIRNIVKELT